MLGNDILIKPVVGALFDVIEEKYFTSPISAVYYNGRELKGEPIATAEYQKLDINLAHVSPEKGVPVYNFSARFKTTVKFDKDKVLVLRSDDGATVWIDGVKVHEDKTTHPAMFFPLGTVQKDIEHSIEIEYFQADGEAAIGLYCDADCSDITEIYLPEGMWLDVFGGKVYNGGKSVRRAFGLREMPLFIRLGALIPLAYEAKNTKEQKWDKLVYDFYPDKQSADRGYLYEDDGETTAYKFGRFRKSAYETHYSTSENAFIIKLHAADGEFSGERAWTMREITLKYHLLKGADGVKKVTVNGEEYGYKKFKKSAAFPLDTGETASDSGVISLSVQMHLKHDCIIKFYL